VSGEESVIQVAVDGESSADGTGRLRSDGATATAGPTTTANIASWLLVLAFVGFVLSVVVPAMGDGARADWAAALLFMFGLATTLIGTGMAVVAAVAKARAVLGGLVMLAGLVLMYGIVPSIAALGVVLVGTALEISSLPGD
jgi:predicted membrane protein